MGRGLVRIGGAVVAVLLAIPGLAAPAWAEGDFTADSYVVDAKLTVDGVLTVAETITFGETFPATVTQTIPLSTIVDGTLRYRYTIADAAITRADGSAVPRATARQKGGDYVVTVPLDAATGPVTIAFTVSGATRTAADGGTSFAWGVLQGLSLGVVDVSGSVSLPPGFTNLDCQAGDPKNPGTCGTYSGGTHGGTTLTFTDGPRPAGEVVVAEASYPSGIVAATESVSTLWSLGRALRPGTHQLLIMAGVVIVGGLLLLGAWRRSRHDNPAKPVELARFADTGAGATFVVDPKARPGVVGTLIDAHVDPIDIVATLLDLAVRGHVLITEQLPTRRFAMPDWTITRRQGADALAPYEQTLLNAIVPTGETSLAHLSSTIGASVGQVQESLYRQIIADGWYSRHPRKHSGWLTLAWIGLVVALAVTAALIALTTYGLVGIGLVVVALIGVFVATDLTPLTAKGRQVLHGFDDLATALRTARPGFAPGDVVAQVSRVLPYAVVLGGKKRWLGTLVATDTDDAPDSTDLDWYHAPADWHLRDLPDSLHAFITVATGRLFSRE